MKTFPEDLFEMVKARIISSGERQMIGVLGGGGGGGGVGGDHRIAVSG